MGVGFHLFCSRPSLQPPPQLLAPPVPAAALLGTLARVLHVVLLQEVSRARSRYGTSENKLPTQHMAKQESWVGWVYGPPARALSPLPLCSLPPQSSLSLQRGLLRSLGRGVLAAAP